MAREMRFQTGLEGWVNLAQVSLARKQKRATVLRSMLCPPTNLSFESL
jgi:hypothetical protein